MNLRVVNCFFFVHHLPAGVWLLPPDEHVVTRPHRWDQRERDAWFALMNNRSTGPKDTDLRLFFVQSH